MTNSYFQLTHFLNTTDGATLLMLFLAVAIPVVIIRWVMRVNIQVSLLKEIRDSLQSLQTIQIYEDKII